MIPGYLTFRHPSGKTVLHTTETVYCPETGESLGVRRVASALPGGEHLLERLAGLDRDSRDETLHPAIRRDALRCFARTVTDNRRERT